MNREIMQNFHAWFDNYVDSFYSGDSDVDFHIKLKEEHTLRVCKNILSIGKSIGLDENSLYIAETTALFHDIGRFEQFSRYRTFSDSKSENHASLGVKALKELRVLECLDESERNIVLKAIEYHNICCLPVDEEPVCLLFSRLIRDADKLDIFEILVNYYEKPENYPNLKVWEASKVSGYSEIVINDILNNKNIKYTDIKTSEDMKILRLSWVFDINFDYTLKKVVEKGFIEKIIKSLPCTQDIEKVKRHIETYVDNRFNNIL